MATHLVFDGLLGTTDVVFPIYACGFVYCNLFTARSSIQAIAWNSTPTGSRGAIAWTIHKILAGDPPIQFGIQIALEEFKKVREAMVRDRNPYPF